MGRQFSIWTFLIYKRGSKSRQRKGVPSCPQWVINKLGMKKRMDQGECRWKCSKTMRANKETQNTEALWTLNQTLPGWCVFAIAFVFQCLLGVTNLMPLHIQGRWFFYLSEAWVLIHTHQSSCSVTLFSTFATHCAGHSAAWPKAESAHRWAKTGFTFLPTLPKNAL